MATLVLTTVGSIIGGPIGATVGSFIGQQVDSKIFGSGNTREGPRLKDLAVTTSSYGQPIPRHFGTMRVAGSVIWASDLEEASETSGGGKGKPKTKTYSYSSSFAVALSSRPIHSLGRIWADGKLLRGAAGDLKTGGELRIYLGHEDEGVDPLLASAEGASCPAFRGLAYVVFENLQLEDFGNRIPSLSFEVRADAVNEVQLVDVLASPAAAQSDVNLTPMLGFSDEGGSLETTLGVLTRAYPMLCSTAGGTLSVGLLEEQAGEITTLPDRLAARSGSNEVGETHETIRSRRKAQRPFPTALRYYDLSRDFQPGVQRAVGRANTGREYTLELPATFEAGGASSLGGQIAKRTSWQNETMRWTIAELDPRLSPGSRVRFPGSAGVWVVQDWEWHENGVELTLEKLAPNAIAGITGDAGGSVPPRDIAPPPSRFWAFELPWDGTGSSRTPSLYAALSSENDGWTGAALYLEQAETLQPLDQATSKRSTFGELTSAVGPSSGLMLEQAAVLDIELVSDDLSFATTNTAGLAGGANQLLVGDEIIQFHKAEQIDARNWRLKGLLRGRAGTESSAMDGHLPGTRAVLLDNTLLRLDSGRFPSSTETRLAALGFGDSDPVISDLSGAGSTRRPFAPVHCSANSLENGDLHLAWTRRARGQWLWEDHVDAPLVEENERYLVGLGDTDSPVASWSISKPTMTLPANEVSTLTLASPGAAIWVRQLGTYGRSCATFITNLD